MNRPSKFLALICSAFVGAASAQTPNVAANAPKDKPASVQSDALEKYERAIAPHVAEAKRTYPEAKKKFLAGLPQDQSFFVTTRLRDSSGRFEQVFIAVTGIEGGKITGIVWNEIRLVSGFSRGDKHEFPESDMLDWLITHPDGTEEGNFVGKFLDTYGGGV